MYEDLRKIHENYHGNIVGLWGVASSGKDTICSHLGMQRAAFADYLKALLEPVLSDKLGLDMDRYEDKAKARELLVALGKLGRLVDPDFWIRSIDLPYRPRFGAMDYEDVCLTDIRYFNEMLWAHQKGGIIIEVKRPGHGFANDEERKSFEEIYRLAPEYGINIKQVLNDGSPSQVASEVRELLREHWSEGKAA